MISFFQKRWAISPRSRELPRYLNSLALTTFKLWYRIRDHYLRSLVACTSSRTDWRSGLGPASVEATWSSVPVFESSSSHLLFEVLVSPISLFDEEYLGVLWTLPLILSFCYPPARPWQPKRHVEA